MGNINTHKQIVAKYFYRKIYLYLAILIVIISFIIHTFTLALWEDQTCYFVTFRAS